MSVWSAPVRYAECDQQGVVFNAHYLAWCDEALGAFCRARGLADLADGVRLASSTLTWHAAARWGDVVDVDARCTRVGRTSFVLDFTLGVGERLCCTVTTVYVDTDPDGRPRPITDATRAALG